MKALTIHQPFAWAIFNAGKNIENRNWRPPQELIGQRIAVHVSQPQRWPNHEEWERISVVICARQRGLCLDDFPDPTMMERGSVIGTIEIGAVTDTQEFGVASWWYDDASRYAWWIRKPRTLEVPIQCRGNQGLWRLPAEVEAEMRGQI